MPSETPIVPSVDFSGSTNTPVPQAVTSDCDGCPQTELLFEKVKKKKKKTKGGAEDLKTPGSEYDIATDVSASMDVEPTATNASSLEGRKRQM